MCVGVDMCIWVCVYSFSVFYNLDSAFCNLHSGLGHPISASASFLAMVTWRCDQIQLKRIKRVSPHAVVARLAHHEVRASKHTWAEISVGITEGSQTVSDSKWARCHCAIISSQRQQYPSIRLPLRWATIGVIPIVVGCHIIGGR